MEGANIGVVTETVQSVIESMKGTITSSFAIVTGEGVTRLQPDKGFTLGCSPIF